VGSIVTLVVTADLDRYGFESVTGLWAELSRKGLQMNSCNPLKFTRQQLDCLELRRELERVPYGSVTY